MRKSTAPNNDISDSCKSFNRLIPDLEIGPGTVASLAQELNFDTGNFLGIKPYFITNSRGDIIWVVPVLKAIAIHTPENVWLTAEGIPITPDPKDIVLERKMPNNQSPGYSYVYAQALIVSPLYLDEVAENIQI